MHFAVSDGDTHSPTPKKTNKGPTRRHTNSMVAPYLDGLWLQLQACHTHPCRPLDCPEASREALDLVAVCALLHQPLEGSGRQQPELELFEAADLEQRRHTRDAELASGFAIAQVVRYVNAHMQPFDGRQLLSSVSPPQPFLAHSLHNEDLKAPQCSALPTASSTPTASASIASRTSISLSAGILDASFLPTTWPSLQQI
mmetsp:Transcript_30820/g.89639  ORF Transcript_30820/g.89639 Transcript_30820/m.89639 type:complete len:200 (+) Transcript_30820:328-927(+)